MISSNWITVFVLLAVASSGVFSQTPACTCPVKYAPDGVTKCALTMSTNPCSCNYTCSYPVLPTCTFDADRSACLARAGPGLICNFTITNPLTCASRCSCYSPPTNCDFTAQRADCLKKNPNCVFKVLSNTKCQSSCSCPIPPPPCDFTASRAKCAAGGPGCIFNIISSTTGRCASSCNCTSITNTGSTTCNLMDLKKYADECNAKTNCVANTDLSTCQIGCRCSSGGDIAVISPASCEYNVFKNKCLNKPGNCSFSLLSLTDCNFSCFCDTPADTAASCDAELYKNLCLTTPGATCTFTRGDTAACNLSCSCLKL